MKGIIMEKAKLLWSSHTDAIKNAQKPVTFVLGTASGSAVWRIVEMGWLWEINSIKEIVMMEIQWSMMDAPDAKSILDSTVMEPLHNVKQFVEMVESKEKKTAMI